MKTWDAMTAEETGVSRDAIEAIAADWVIRLEDGVLLLEERQTLDDWLGASAEHRAAFDFAHSTWWALGALPITASVLADDADLAGTDVAAPSRRITVPSTPRRTITPDTPNQFRRAGGSPTHRFLRAGILAAGMVLALGLAAIWEGDPGTLVTADYRTAPDETRRIDLSDGSQVVLGPSSALALRFNDARRGFDLLSGIAYITVAKTVSDPKLRPFQVDAGLGSATALGTQYMIEMLDKTVRVTVAEHDVEVSLSSDTGISQKIVLQPGDSVRYSAQTGLQSVEHVSLERAAGWRDGRLVFDRVPLAEVVAVLNRYRRGRIVIADSDLATRTVSGSFNTSELNHALQAITRELNAKTVAVQPFITLLF